MMVAQPATRAAIAAARPTGYWPCTGPSGAVTVVVPSRRPPAKSRCPIQRHTKGRPATHSGPDDAIAIAVHTATTLTEAALRAVARG
ncbi:hypothetical protein [Streptomyces lunaelactis]|uniref:hypothetical protein n=1 Tax=Streptomyces lunaelactis TaxID=1535768 RepID=UPI00158519F2|nr:hypothetical protein [Streptomyces lunaelactis]NUK03955.1 hypothetical protein [Streptomyces lunaelactis]NUK18240.1 hypothetical protein [Streptomyces lunaelactis]